MSDISALIWDDGSETAKANTTVFRQLAGPEHVITAVPRGNQINEKQSGLQIKGDSLFHGGLLRAVLEGCRTRYLAAVIKPGFIVPETEFSAHLQSTFEKTHASMLYSAFFVRTSPSDIPGQLQPLIDCQEGSVRDDFDFGHLVFFDLEKVRRTLSLHKYTISETDAGFYGLRLFLGLDSPPHRISSPLYSVINPPQVDSEKTHFQYLEKDSKAVQREMETVFTYFAKKAGFYLPPRTQQVEFHEKTFPVEASVVIPVKNRVTTVADAVDSAAAQQTGFPFNIIVVDNYSSDGTSEKLQELMKKHKNLVHVIPQFGSLDIGGCWNEALFHPRAGRFCVQLDSDDLYSAADTLEKIISVFHEKKVAAVVGSYQLVNSRLEAIPPGIIDHREWTDENGHNNALRINGFGAPRAYYTPIARQIRFPNVGYGEDYSMMLAITRQYRIARIYDVLYLCRRWEGNSDARPSLEKVNAHNYYKDTVRTQEILKRKGLQV